MPIFVLERVTPPTFDVGDPNQVALHSRWAADAYAAAGIVWLGGVAVHDGRMYSLIVAESVDDVERYCRSIGIERSAFKVSEVIATLGPHSALSRNDPRYRPLGA
jgi:hypothetical protein